MFPKVPSVTTNEHVSLALICFPLGLRVVELLGELLRGCNKVCKVAVDRRGQGALRLCLRSADGGVDSVQLLPGLLDVLLCTFAELMSFSEPINEE